MIFRFLFLLCAFHAISIAIIFFLFFIRFSHYVIKCSGKFSLRKPVYVKSQNEEELCGKKNFFLHFVSMPPLLLHILFYSIWKLLLKSSHSWWNRKEEREMNVCCHGSNLNESFIKFSCLRKRRDCVERIIERVEAVGGHIFIVV